MSFRFNFQDADGDGECVDAEEPQEMFVKRDSNVDECVVRAEIVHMDWSMMSMSQNADLECVSIVMCDADAASAPFEFHKRRVADLSNVQSLHNERLRSIVEKSDLQPRIYEGGFKLWECSIDAVRFFAKQKFSFAGKRVADIGCGHGLPGIYALDAGASFVCFQDLNRDVLELVTAPNIAANIHMHSSSAFASRTRLVCGDWRHSMMVPMLMKSPEALEAPGAVPEAEKFDLLVSCDTLYSTESIPALVDLIAASMKRDGQAVVIAKRFYFGVGGSTIAFMDAVDNHVSLQATVVDDIQNGESNIRDVIIVTFN